MGIRDSEADENVSSSHVRDQNGPKRRNAKIVKAFHKRQVFPTGNRVLCRWLK